MTDAAKIADSYIALWNETDRDRRLTLIAGSWTEDAHYRDPLMQGDGHDGIDALIAGVHHQFPGCRFALRGTPDGYNDRVRFSWSLAPEGAPPVAHGTDFVLLSGDGKIRDATGFLDMAPTGA